MATFIIQSQNFLAQLWLLHFFVRQMILDWLPVSLILVYSLCLWLNESLMISSGLISECHLNVQSQNKQWRHYSPTCVIYFAKQITRVKQCNYHLHHCFLQMWIHITTTFLSILSLAPDTKVTFHFLQTFCVIF